VCEQQLKQKNQILHALDRANEAVGDAMSVTPTETAVYRKLKWIQDGILQTSFMVSSKRTSELFRVQKRTIR
jgi:hypothetical protein